MKNAIFALFVPLLLPLISHAQNTPATAARCAMDLIKGTPRAEADEKLWSSAAALLADWIDGRLERVTDPQVRAQVLEAMHRTAIDDSRLREADRVRFLADEQRIVLRASRRGRLMTTWLYVHELERLVAAQATGPGGSPPGFMETLAPDRQVEAEALRREHAFAHALHHSLAGDAICRHLLREEGVSGKALDVLVHMLRATEVSEFVVHFPESLQAELREHPAELADIAKFMLRFPVSDVKEWMCLLKTGQDDYVRLRLASPRSPARAD